MDRFLLFAEGTLVALTATVAAFVIALILGLVSATFKLSHYKAARFLAGTYINLFRGVPEIITVMALYYGGSVFLEYYAPELVPSPFWGGVYALGLAYGAFCSEVIRAGLLAVPYGQIEAARAIGMSRLKRIRRVVLPLALRHSIPGLGNLSQSLLKDTSLLSVIAVPELMWRTQITINFTKRPFDYYLLCALIYMLLTAVIITIINLISRNNDHIQVASS